MFLCFGVVLVDAPYLLCVLWVGLVELLLSYLPGVVRLVSMSTHLANVVGQTAAEPSVPMLGAWSPEIPAWSSACVLAAVGGAFLLAATSLAGGSELRYGKA